MISNIKIYSSNKYEMNNNDNNGNGNNGNDNNNDNNNKYIKHVSECVGWIGSVLVLIPYVVTLDKTTDFALNTAGASGLFIVCVTSKQYQSIVINAAWIIGGFYKYFYK